MMEELANAAVRCVGTKQVIQAVRNGKTGRVYLAMDADERIRQKVCAACEEAGVEIIEVTSMQRLGQACRIQVGAAAACVQKQ